MSDTLVVNEIFLSLQGESTWAGLPCMFIRLTGCHLRCSYCDTAYAFAEGRRMALEEVRGEVHRLAAPFAQQTVSESEGPVHRASSSQQHSHNPQRAVRDENASSTSGPFRLPLVELTGGEPLLQPNSLPLLKSLCDDGFTVLLETSGAVDIAPVDPRVHRIMDLKCPSSGEEARNRWENLRHLTPRDEIKFVIGTREDYAWAKRIITERNLAAQCPLLVSWATPLTPAQQDQSLKPLPPDHTPLIRRELAELVLADALPVRFQVQMHKCIWPADTRGV